MGANKKLQTNVKNKTNLLHHAECEQVKLKTVQLKEGDRA